MDSGLLLCSSVPSDAHGFLPYDASPPSGNSEALVAKGILWARFGALVVINTHMTFHNADHGEQRAHQRAQLVALVARLLGVSQESEACGDSSDASSNGPPLSNGFRPIPSPSTAGLDVDSSVASHVIIAGDLNHCLGQQTLPLVGKPPKGASPSVYSTPWLPEHASIEHLLQALKLGGACDVRRMSSDMPTNEDGTVDHVLYISRNSSAGPRMRFHTVTYTTTPDADAENSDHLMVSTHLELS